MHVELLNVCVFDLSDLVACQVDDLGLERFQILLFGGRQVAQFLLGDFGFLFTHLSEHGFDCFYVRQAVEAAQ